MTLEVFKITEKKYFTNIKMLLYIILLLDDVYKNIYTMNGYMCLFKCIYLTLISDVYKININFKFNI